MHNVILGLAALQGIEDVLKVFLQYIQRCCSRTDPLTAIHLLGQEVADLLNASTVVRPEVRHGALSAVYAAMTAAMQCDEVCRPALVFCIQAFCSLLLFGGLSCAASVCAAVPLGLH